jgi:hypothetical protein
MEGAIGTIIVAIIIIVAHIIKAIRENANAAKQSPPDRDEEQLPFVTRPKSSKQPKPSQQPSKHYSKGTKQRSLTRQPLGEGWDISDDGNTRPSQRLALSKALSPQGEGHRFDADPGTLDTAHIVAPTIDPMVNPQLESITGIYEEGAMFADRSQSAITLNIADLFAKPEGIVQAVLFSEILKRPDWKESP